jgi:acyl-CoA thioester hydrolase
MSNIAVSSGTIVDGAHLFAVRVYYEDTDAGGIVYHANYLRFAERARTEFMRLRGWANERLRAEIGHVWVVRRAEMDFLAPARLEETLTVASTIERVKPASVEVSQIVRRGAVDLVRLKLQLVLLTPLGRIGRIPAVLKAALLAPAADLTQSSLSAN